MSYVLTLFTALKSSPGVTCLVFICMTSQYMQLHSMRLYAFDRLMQRVTNIFLTDQPYCYKRECPPYYITQSSSQTESCSWDSYEQARQHCICGSQKPAHRHMHFVHRGLHSWQAHLQRVSLHIHGEVESRYTSLQISRIRFRPRQPHSASNT